MVDGVPVNVIKSTKTIHLASGLTISFSDLTNSSHTQVPIYATSLIGLGDPVMEYTFHDWWFPLMKPFSLYSVFTSIILQLHFHLKLKSNNNNNYPAEVCHRKRRQEHLYYEGNVIMWRKPKEQWILGFSKISFSPLYLIAYLLYLNHQIHLFLVSHLSLDVTCFKMPFLTGSSSCVLQWCSTVECIKIMFTLHGNDFEFFLP